VVVPGALTLYLDFVNSFTFLPQFTGRSPLASATPAISMPRPARPSGSPGISICRVERRRSAP